MKKLNKKFQIFRVINSQQSLLPNSEIVPRHKRLYFVSNKTNGIKIGLQL